MQFEVAAHRLRYEFNAPAQLESLPYTLARVTDATTAGLLPRTRRGVEFLTRPDGELVAVFADTWRLNALMREFPQARFTEILRDPEPSAELPARR